MREQERAETQAKAFYNRSASTPTNAIEVPHIALPKGGGALKGIDEKFTVNAANATASLGLPLPLTAARATPSISLRYDSGGGNGVFGLGWSLDIPAIARRTDKQLPRYFDGDESDVFLLSGAEDLVPALHDDGTAWESVVETVHVKRYRPRVEGAFALIERISPLGGDWSYWKVTSAKNAVTFYGMTRASRIADPHDPRKVFRWLPELAHDDKGNVVVYEYKAEDGAPGVSGLCDRNRYDALGNARFTNRYLKRMRYGNREPWYSPSPYTPSVPASLTFSFEVVLDYGEHGAPPAAADMQATVDETEQQSWLARADAHSDYRAGFEIRNMRLCRRVLMFHRFDELGPEPCLVRSLDLDYAASQPDTVQFAEVTYLAGATSRGYTRRSGSTNVYDFSSLPRQAFSYQALHWQLRVQQLSAADAVNAPVGLADDYQFVDLWNEGISGILSEQAGALFYKSNLGDGHFTPASVVAEKPSFTGLGSRLSLEDLDADGSKQLVTRSRSSQGFFELAADRVGWEPFTRFPQVLNIDGSAPNRIRVDLDGDGRADMMVTEESVTRWYPSLGRAGFGPSEMAPKARDEEQGPVLIWNDPQQRIFLADLSGDGLSDIVRIRNGEVCYWPNLGYGNFGEKVTMERAPLFAATDTYDPRYLHLADLTGTGASDLLYLDGAQAKVWLNFSGNAWSEPLTIALPETVLPNRLSAVDLLGNGTACLVWSSPLPGNADAALRYVDLFGGKKPHLLTGYTNGSGDETLIFYRSSTQFYLDDNRAGTPWKTRLPFPMQCVARVEKRELVTDTLFVGEYSYHHGYYDHAEREFRGFGRVDETDTESFTRWVRESASNIVDEGFHQPIVLTRTWFHTGAPPADGDPLGLFADDYWTRNATLLAVPGFVAPEEPSLPPAIFPIGLDPAELREAYRACKGMTLRQEIFALDAPAQGATDSERITQWTPYSVALHNCQVRRVQPRGGNRYASFLVHESEALTLNYERCPADVRIGHRLHLEIDAYGNPLRSVAVDYARQLASPPAGVPDGVWSEQKKARLALSEHTFSDDEFTAALSPYRLPVECESKNFELTGVALPEGKTLFDLGTLRSAASAAIEIGFEVTPPDDGQPRKRLVEDHRVLHLAADLASPLAFKKASPLGLPFASYQLAFTPTLLRSLFPSTKIADAEIPKIFGEDARYVHFDDGHGATDTNWWVPSGTVDYLDAQRAPMRFYQPTGYLDARGGTTFVRYVNEDATRSNPDAHWNLLGSTIDAVGNTTLALAYDFRVLAPTRLQDPNLNLSEGVHDNLGRVVAVALMGKGNEADSLDLLKTRLADRPTQSQQMQAFLTQGDDSSATWLLADATTRWIYDDSQLPLCAATISRERHVQDLLQTGDALKLQLAFEYSGGAGKAVMRKIRVPGRWLGNGRTVRNNKGNPVKQFEPYFSITHVFEDDSALTDTGVSPFFTYDSAGRHLRTDHPDGTFDFTTFDSWSQIVFDRNDTVLESDWYAARIALPAGDPQRVAAEQTALHDQTPVTIHLDSLGREMCSVAYNRGKDANGVVQETFPVIRAQLDIEGNVRGVVDARDNTVVASDVDLLGRVIHQSSPDTGERWTVPDVTGSPVYGWDSRDQRVRYVYDLLHRPVQEWLSIGSAPETLFLSKEWGETAPAPESHNLRGQVWRNWDPAGLFESVGFDFQGRRLESRRQFTTEWQDTIAWPATNPEALLEQETFRTRASYDALGRPTVLYSPDTPQVPATPIALAYDEGGRLAQVRANLRGAAAITPFVNGIDYNEKGQRLSIAYGNGVTTRYEYDRETFRLTRIVTSSAAGPALQDIRYIYDPMANIVSQTDDAQQATFFAGAVAKPGSSFEYDALYRLTRALGREQIGQNAPTSEWDFERGGQILPGDAQAMQPYDERYEYDLVGNILRLVHSASSGGQFINRWTRAYTYEAASNRLLSTQIGDVVSPYAYNPHGSMQSLASLQAMDWDPAERLQHIRQGTTEAYYAYDDTGRRARKVVEKQGGLREVRLYFGEFEIFRRYRSETLVLERETQHILDDKRRIALVDTLTVGDDGSPPQLIRYQLANHLGSAAIELDGSGALITYEEYHPFGSTSWQAGRTLAEVSLKRYRYTGQERDEESGLGYHGARYYAPWLGRWISTDPAGLVDGPNLYAYAMNNPVALHDPNGLAAGAPNEYDRVIMQMRSDGELKEFLGGLSPELQVAMAAGATGAFSRRVAATIKQYNLQNVRITSATRTIGDVAQYKNQGKANYLDLFGSKRRADEAEHLLATAAIIFLLGASSKWKRDSPTIVLAEAQSRLKTPTDNQLTRDLKAGKITAEEWLKHSRTNAYRSFFEARALGIAQATPEQFAAAIIAQERMLKLELAAKIQREIVYGKTDSVTRFMAMAGVNLKANVGTQSLSEQQSAVVGGAEVVGISAIAAATVAGLIYSAVVLGEVAAAVASSKAAVTVAAPIAAKVATTDPQELSEELRNIYKTADALGATKVAEELAAEAEAAAADAVEGVKYMVR